MWLMRAPSQFVQWICILFVTEPNFSTELTAEGVELLFHLRVGSIQTGHLCLAVRLGVYLGFPI